MTIRFLIKYDRDPSALARWDVFERRLNGNALMRSFDTWPEAITWISRIDLHTYWAYRDARRWNEHRCPERSAA